MTTDSFFTLACTGLIGLLFGTVLAFAGYRLFIFLLPIWGFFFGLGLGAQAVQALLGSGFLADVTSWVVGFVVGLLFALLSYLFYAFAVAMIGGSLGYAVAVGFLTWLGLQFGFLVWIIGIAVGVVVAFVTIVLNLQKWVVIAATAILGTGVVFGTILVMFNPLAKLLVNPVAVLLSTSPLLLILFIVVAAAGAYVQIRSTPAWTVESYNRVENPI
ncbi:MAG TPA: DUF4203 domain-containing protein [Anaerolineales bacterium]|nr:DUF4203 domain-containing protein [Anaerolineales bacterium]